jgi:hypothetical protein
LAPQGPQIERDKRRSPSLSQYVRLRVEPVNCQPRFEGL